MAASNYKFAFVMDPMQTVLVDKDTTFVMMLEAQARGHQIFFLGLKDMYSRGSRPFCRASRGTTDANRGRTCP